MAPYTTLVLNSTAAAVTYSFSLDGTAKSYSASAGESWASVAAGVTTAIGSDYTVDSSVTNQLRISKNTGAQVSISESMAELSVRNTLRIQSLTGSTPPVVASTTGSLLDTSLATTGTVTLSQPINRVAFDLGSVGVWAQSYGFTVGTTGSSGGNINATVSPQSGRLWTTAGAVTGLSEEIEADLEQGGWLQVTQVSAGGLKVRHLSPGATQALTLTQSSGATITATSGTETVTDVYQTVALTGSGSFTIGGHHLLGEWRSD